MSEKSAKALCKRCKKEIEIMLPVSFSATCDFCYEYIHSCVFCKFYDPTKYTCAAQVSEQPKNSASKNNCDEFFLQTNKTEDASNRSEQAKKNLHTLFKEPSSDDKPKKSIQDLFKDI